jgi:hypothetical protein
MGRGGNGKGGGGDGGGGGGDSYQHGADWVCPLNHCAYRNFAYRMRCRRCESPRNGGKHSQHGGGKGGDAPAGTATLAQRQVELERVRTSHQKKEEKLRKEKADLKRQLDAALAAAKAPPTIADEDADEDMEDGDEVDVEKELEVARKKKKLMQDVWADDDPEVLRIDELIKKLVRRRDEAKPQRVRLRILERNIDKCQRQHDAKEKQLAELDTKIKELQEEREERRAQLELAAKNLEAARAERAAELQKALEEDAAKCKSAAATADSATGDPAAMAFYVIRDQTRARLPGAQPGLGNAIDQALGQLLSLLAALPEQPPSSVAAGAKNGSAAASGGGGGGPGQQAGAATAGSVTAAAAQPGAAVADSRGTNASGAIDDGVIPQLAATQAAELRRQQSLAEKQREQTLAIQQFTENYQAQLQQQAAAREQAAAAAAAAAGTAGAGSTGHEHIDDDDSDLDASIPSDGESDIGAMQLDRAEGETEQDRNNRVAKFLAEKRKRKKEEKRKERQTRRRANNQGGTSRRDKEKS